MLRDLTFFTISMQQELRGQKKKKKKKSRGLDLIGIITSHPVETCYKRIRRVDQRGFSSTQSSWCFVLYMKVDR